ncbi:MAG: histidine kinase [Novosphingobium sp.]|nr:histidine kinase [Novosphingobium sp.]
MDPPHFTPTPIPRERRRKRCAHMTLTDSSGHAIEVMVRDLSSRGMSAAAAGMPPACNDVLRARMEDGRELWGIVRWVNGNLFGMEFDIHA